jgi:hypothetical protein
MKPGVGWLSAGAVKHVLLIRFIYFNNEYLKKIKGDWHARGDINGSGSEI